MMKFPLLFLMALHSVAFSFAVRADSSAWHPQSLRTEIEFFALSSAIDYDLKSYNPPYAFEHKAFMLGFSRQITDYLAVEFRFARGDEMELPGNTGGTVSQEFTRMFGAYGRVGWPLSRHVEPYFLFGFSNIQRDSSNWLVDDLQLRDSGVGFGGGLKVRFGETFALRLESVRFIDKSDVEVVGTSAGVSITF